MRAVSYTHLKVIGYAGLLVAADEGYITNVAVDPSRRRQGVAAQLLQVFDNFAPVSYTHLAMLFSFPMSTSVYIPSSRAFRLETVS